ncbi:MAG: glycosyltransferase family 2 protein [Ignavibacteria bacterium]
MISVIILNYNGRMLLQTCLDSVLQQTYRDFEIIVLDNGSSDGSYEFLKANYSNIPNVTVIYSKKNLGFAGGNNYALNFAQGEYVVLLNNDTIVDINWLKELYNAITTLPNAGIVQSLVITEGIPEEYYSQNGTLNLFGNNIMKIFNIGTNGIGEILQANGCSLIFPKKIISTVRGLFIDEYFAYAEDSFFSLKVKFAGYYLYHNSKSFVKHRGGSTTRREKISYITFLQERNRLLNFLILFSPLFLIKYIPLLVLNFWLKFVYSLISSQLATTGILRAYLWLIFNFKWISGQRRKYKLIKKITDTEVLKYISGKVSDNNDIISKTLNKITLLYCKLTNIKVFELW